MSKFDHLLRVDDAKSNELIREDLRLHVEDTGCPTCAAGLAFDDAGVIGALENWSKAEVKRLDGKEPAHSVRVLFDAAINAALNVAMGVNASHRDGRLSLVDAAMVTKMVLDVAEQATVRAAADYLEMQLDRAK